MHIFYKIIKFENVVPNYKDNLNKNKAVLIHITPH